MGPLDRTVDGLHGARLSWVVLGVIAFFGVALAGGMSLLAASAAAASAPAFTESAGAETPRPGEPSAAFER